MINVSIPSRSSYFAVIKLGTVVSGTISITQKKTIIAPVKSSVTYELNESGSVVGIISQSPSIS